MRPGYGYAGIRDPNSDVMTPDNAGIYRVDMETGKHELIITIKQIVDIAYPHGDISQNKHYFNCLLINPDGTRFFFMDRWRTDVDPDYNRLTRLFTATLDGKDIHIINDDGNTSHLIWCDPTHILAWAIRHPQYGDRFLMFTDDGSREVDTFDDGSVMYCDSHVTFLPGNEWLLYDTYPDDRRFQHVNLYHVATGKKIPVGYFYSPPKYKFDHEWRVDLHPRFSPDGRHVVIDSPHGGAGRQLYLIDISQIIGKK